MSPVMDLSPLWTDLAAIARDTSTRWTVAILWAFVGFVGVLGAITILALLPGALADLWRTMR